MKGKVIMLMKKGLLEGNALCLKKLFRVLNGRTCEKEMKR